MLQKKVRKGELVKTVNNIAYKPLQSFFRPYSRDEGTRSDSRPHFALIDEVHEHPTAEQINKLRAGFKFRTQLFSLEITNSGFDRTSICWQHHEHAEHVLRQALVAERERLTAAFEHRLPPLDAAISKARKTAEKTRHAYLAADLVLRKAAGARYALVATHDRQRDGINATLRASSSPAIATFQAEMRDRENARRRNFSGQHYERLDRPPASGCFSQTCPASNGRARRSGPPSGRRSAS